MRFACAVFFRRELLKSAKNFLLIGVAPVIGGVILTWALVKSVIDLADPANSESGDSWLGLGPPLVIGIFFLILGVVLMLLQRIAAPEFFRRKTETADPELLTGGSAVSPAAAD